MAYRFTNTDKWADEWFSDLKPTLKLLFLYLCDQCDIAGFMQVNAKKIAFDLSIGKQEAENGLRGLSNRVIMSKDGKYLFVKNFIKNQKNFPLDIEKNPAHRGIVKRLNDNLELFDFQSIDNYFTSSFVGASKPLGRGIGNGNGNITWKNNFNIYLEELKSSYNSIMKDREFIEEREKYHPNLDIRLSLEKACKDYWATEAGWKLKKSKRIESIDWKSTFRNSLTLKSNQVYKQQPSNQEPPQRTYTLLNGK